MICRRTRQRPIQRLGDRETEGQRALSLDEGESKLCLTLMTDGCPWTTANPNRLTLSIQWRAEVLRRAHKSLYAIRRSSKETASDELIPTIAFAKERGRTRQVQEII